MAATLLDGPLDWRLSRDDAGYRTYVVRFLVEVSDPLDGPATASNAAGLPVPGDPWIIDNDIDVWCWCRPEATVTPLVTDEPNTFFVLEYTFSNRPPALGKNRDGQRDHTSQRDDPMLEPDRASGGSGGGISGGFAKQKKEATHDRHGKPIRNSAHEQLRGPQVEFDESSPLIKVIQNRPLLEFELLCSMIDTLNDAQLWGFPARWVKLSNVTWEQQHHGAYSVYYVRTLEFEVRKDWDRDLLDEGTKVLNGHWGAGGAEGTAWVLDNIDGAAPDATNPSHFIRAVDRHDNPMKVILDGEGKPATKQGAVIQSMFISGDYVYFRLESAAVGIVVGDEVEIVGTYPPFYSGQFTIAVVDSTTLYGIAKSEFGDAINVFEWVSGGTVYFEGLGPGNIHVEKYHSANFLLLGLPLTF